MKKSNRKLQLHRETVHQLDPKTLDQIQGGQMRDTAVRPSDACPVPTV
ncbi:MAG TPA: class I lanthipeptide [Thermoanaerobaculia bacterium]|nr:class I lanthipeptide [Thermoanaerobaculia bacterium]